MGDKYQDIEGNDITLDKLCRTEPAWAANVIRTQQSQLRTLAEAVLEAHKVNCSYCPAWDKDGDDHEIFCRKIDASCCQCPACQMAREIMKAKP